MSDGGGVRGRYVAALQQLATDENRAALASLRRGLGARDGIAPEMHRYVVPWLPAASSAWEEPPFYQVAALFAWHQKPWAGEDAEVQRSSNLGASCAWLGRKTGSDSVEKRFVALLNSHRDDLYPKLRNMIGLLRSHDIPVDWAQLLRDVQGWGYESRSVQRAWARAYWDAGSAREEDPAGDDSQPENIQ